MLAAAIFNACSTREQPPLTPEKMQQVLYDIHLAEAYSMQLPKDSNHHNQERNLDSLAAYYQAIFTHYKLTPEGFLQALDWYKKHPEDLDTIYIRMIPQINEEASRYNRN